jgi:hypothetical protein
MLSSVMAPQPAHVAALYARVCLCGTSTLVTNMHSYGRAIALVMAVLHALPRTMRVLLILPSVHHYRMFWQPRHDALFPAEPLAVRAYRRVQPSSSVVLHCDNVPGMRFDVAVTLEARRCTNANHVLRVGPVPAHPHAWCLDVRQPVSAPRWLLAESPLPYPADELTESEAAAQQVCDLVMGGTKRATVTSLARVLGEAQCPGQLVMVVSSDVATMHALALPLITAGVPVLTMFDEYVTPALARRMAGTVGVVIVHHAFQELAALATMAARVFVLDTLVRPDVLRELWVLSHYVPVVTLRVDTRRADSRRVAVEPVDTLRLFPELLDSVRPSARQEHPEETAAPAHEPEHEAALTPAHDDLAQPPAHEAALTPAHDDLAQPPAHEAAPTPAHDDLAQPPAHEAAPTPAHDDLAQPPAHEAAPTPAHDDLAQPPAHEAALTLDEVAKPLAHKELAEPLTHEAAAPGVLSESELEPATRSAYRVALGDVVHCLSCMGVADLWHAARDGVCTFTLMRGDDAAPHGWLFAPVMASIAARLPAEVQRATPWITVKDVEAGVLWGLLQAGKPEALTPVDWAAATTLFLCRVLLGPHHGCTLHFGPMDPAGLFEYRDNYQGRCYAEIARGQAWGAMLDFTHAGAQECVPMYWFNNSATLAVL